MNIPQANISDMNVRSAIIINDNENNLICAEIEPTQLINQRATLETEGIISHTPLSRNTCFFLTIPYYNCMILSTPDDHKIKIIFVVMFLSYTGILFFIIYLLNHDEPMKE